jgi:hypothetical protein
MEKRVVSAEYRNEVSWSMCGKILLKMAGDSLGPFPKRYQLRKLE